MSELRANTISNEAGTGPATLTKQSAAKAWANLNGTGTIALRDSFNISSVVDNDTGNYTFNFSNSMSNANFSLSGFARVAANFGSMVGANDTTFTTGSVRVGTIGSSFSVADALYVTPEINGVLA